jgi:hypothetical protein
LSSDHHKKMTARNGEIGITVRQGLSPLAAVAASGRI